MSEKMMELSTFAEKIQQSQRNSSEFQMQLLKQNDASELEKGVSKVTRVKVKVKVKVKVMVNLWREKV